MLLLKILKHIYSMFFRKFPTLVLLQSLLWKESKRYSFYFAQMKFNYNYILKLLQIPYNLQPQHEKRNFLKFSISFLPPPTEMQKPYIFFHTHARKLCEFLTSHPKKNPQKLSAVPTFLYVYVYSLTFARSINVLRAVQRDFRIPSLSLSRGKVNPYNIYVYLHTAEFR